MKKIEDKDQIAFQKGLTEVEQLRLFDEILDTNALYHLPPSVKQVTLYKPSSGSTVGMRLEFEIGEKYQLIGFRDFMENASINLIAIRTEKNRLELDFE